MEKKGKEKMKRFIAFLLALVMLLALAACGTVTTDGSASASADKSAETASSDSAASADKSADAASGNKKLVIWLEKMFSEEPTDKMIERINQWGKENSVEVEVSLVGAVDFAQKLSAAIEGGGMPDIFMSSYHRYLNFYPDSIAADVTDLYKEIDSQVGFYDSCASTCYIDGVARTIPMYTSCTLMYARADKLKAAGFNSLPTTWEEVFKMARAVSDPANGFFGLGVGCGPTDEDCENTSRMAIWSNGGAFYDDKGNITIDNEATKWWIDNYKQLYDEEVIPTDALTWDPSGNNNTYLTGQSCFVFNAATLARALKSDPANADLFANTWIGAMPAGSAGSVGMSSWNGWAIAEASTQKDLAAELIKYMYDPDWYAEWSEYTAPVLGPSVESVGNSSFWQDDPINAAVIASAMNGKAYYGYSSKDTKGMVVGIKTYYTYKLADTICAVASGDKTYDESIADYVATAKDIAANLQ